MGEEEEGFIVHQSTFSQTLADPFGLHKKYIGTCISYTLFSNYTNIENPDSDDLDELHLVILRPKSFQLAMDFKKNFNCFFIFLI